MKFKSDIMTLAWKDYKSFGMTSSLYLMRKYKLSKEIANQLVKEIEKRSKHNFNAKRCKT